MLGYYHRPEETSEMIRLMSVTMVFGADADKCQALPSCEGALPVIRSMIAPYFHSAPQ